MARLHHALPALAWIALAAACGGAADSDLLSGSSPDGGTGGSGDSDSGTSSDSGTFTPFDAGSQVDASPPSDGGGALQPIACGPITCQAGLACCINDTNGGTNFNCGSVAECQGRGGAVIECDDTAYCEAKEGAGFVCCGQVGTTRVERAQCARATSCTGTQRVRLCDRLLPERGECPDNRRCVDTTQILPDMGLCAP